jgi:hypothetical protein
MTPTAREIRAEIRTYIADRPIEFRTAYLAAFVVGCSLIVTPFDLWAWTLFADTVAVAMGLGAWVYRLRADVATATRRADQWAAQAETFATELTAEREESAAKIRRLSADVLEAQGRAWDAEHAPLADVVPIEGLRVVPEQRDGSHDHDCSLHTCWRDEPPNGDDDIWLNLYDENGRHQ